MKARSLKIVHVITSLDEGGAEGALFRLCTYDTRHQHIVVSLSDAGKYGSLMENAGIVVHSLNWSSGRVSLSGFVMLYRLLRHQRPDVMQTWLYHADLIGGVLGHLAGVPRIVWGIRHSNLTPGTVKRSTIWIARICSVISGVIPSDIVCCSKKAAEVHAQIGYEQKKMRFIPNGYDLTRLRQDANVGERLRAELCLPIGKPLIGMVARFDAQKDHANLIAALAELKRRGSEFHCLLVGTNMTTSNAILTKLIADHNVTERITLLGKRDDIIAVMNVLDIHVLSSLGEAFPNVLAEAMACGTPCVTTDVGDAAHIVGQTGWVVPAQNSHKLADGIEEALLCLSSPLDWLTRKSAARDRIETNFTIERMADLYDEVWRQRFSD